MNSQRHTTSPATSETGPRERLDWRQVLVLYHREIRDALREKAIIVNNILIPIFLYPFIMWAAFTGITFVLGQTEGLVSRIAVRNWPAEHPGLRRSLESNTQLQFLDAGEAERRIRDGQLDALIEFLPPDPAASALARNFQARLTFNESNDRSATARARLVAALDGYRERWVAREALARGVDSAEWRGFAIETRNTASGKQMGGFILGLLLPVLLVVMVAVGCFYPAVDTTAGERERNTWETLMSTPASRLSVVTAKYLYVVSFGGLAGLLNLSAVALTVKPIFGPLLGNDADVLQFALPLAAVPVAALAAVLLAGFVAAAMMVFASFARTFKEGQAMITPFYLLLMVPLMFLQVPGLKLSLALSLLPVVNVTLMVRDAISGGVRWLPAAAAVLASLATIALCLRLAAFILRFEDVVSGSYRGGIHRFLRERFLARRPAAARTPEVAR